MFLWGHSDTSWAHHHDVTILSQYDVTDTQDDYVTMRSQCRHSVMSQIHEMTTHHEVTVLSQDDAHHVRSLWYQNYDITSVMFLLRHSDKCLPHNHEVTVLSQYYVSGTWDDHIIIRSQCCHKTMPTLWGHYDVLMISKLWHHMCEMFVRSQWHKFTTSLWGHSVVIVWRSQRHKMTTSLWGHSVVTLWCHRYTRWQHHHEVIVLSQNDIHHVM